MSNATAEFLILTLADLLEVVVWGGLVAGVLLVWRPRLAGWLTVLQAGLAAVVAACLVPCLWSQDWSPTVEFGSWPALPSLTTSGVRIAHGIDVVAAVALLAAMVAFLMTRRTEAEDRMSENGGRRSERWPLPTSDLRPPTSVIRFLFLQAVLQFVLVDDPVLRIAFLPLMGLCDLWQRVGDATATNGEIVAARRTFLFRLAGDALLLLGTALLVVAVPAANGDATTAGTLLWVGVLVRAGGYPFFGDDESPSDEPLESVLVLPAGVFVLLRMWPAWGSVISAGHGLLYAGVALALLAGSIAAARRHGGSTAIAVALTGMMLVGLGSGSVGGMQGTLLLFASTTVLLPLLRKTGTGPFFGLAPTPRKHVDGRKMDRSPFFGVLLLGVGVGGQGLIFTALFSQPSTVIAGGVLAAGQFLMSFALVRNLGVPTRPSRTPFLVNFLVVLGLAGLIVAVHVAPPAWPPDASVPEIPTPGTWQQHVFEYLLFAILGAIGLTGGWMMRPRTGVIIKAESGRRKAEKTQPTRLPPSALRRWLRAGFYLQELFLLAVVLPLRGAAQLCRFFEWFIIERLWDLPRRAPHWLGLLGEPLQGGSVQMSLAAILLATAALLGVIVGL